MRQLASECFECYLLSPELPHFLIDVGVLWMNDVLLRYTPLHCTLHRVSPREHWSYSLYDED